MTKYQLPLFEDKLILPTNKYHISFSEISDHMACSYRHKLKYIDKIVLEDGSIHTAFGGAVHDSIENFLINKCDLNPENTIKDFKNRLKDLSKPVEPDIVNEFCEQIPDILLQLPNFLNETFPEYKVIGAELLLFENVKGQLGINFKGYIDAILKIKKKRGKGFEYILLDWKSCGWGWKPEQKQSYEKQLQLMLYKYFFCELMNIPHTDVKCGFVLLKRTAPKKRKHLDRLEFVPVSVGPKSIEKALDTLNDTINKIRKGYATKNRMSCEPFCTYYGTNFCK